jgi:hypothetical protein
MGTLQNVRSLKQPVQVKVANGNVMWSNFVVHNCFWLCEGITFCNDFKVLPLGVYDLILGMDWLEDHSPMFGHWAHKWMQFDYKGATIRLQGVKPQVLNCIPVTNCPVYN